MAFSVGEKITLAHTNMNHALQMIGPCFNHYFHFIGLQFLFNNFFFFNESYSIILRSYKCNKLNSMLKCDDVIDVNVPQAILRVRLVEEMEK